MSCDFRNIVYTVEIHKSVKKRKSLGPIVKLIDQVLQDKRGWSYQYSPNMILIFIYHPLAAPSQINLRFVLAGNKYIEKICGSVPNLTSKKLNCYDGNTHTIYIQADRWEKGSYPSGLSRRDYRIYLINHEVGHYLGYGHHLECVKGLIPVMHQQTLGPDPKHHIKCKPNPWPFQRYSQN